MNESSEWTRAQQEFFEAADHLTLAVDDGSDLTVDVGMVVVNGRVYVRAFGGRGSQWFRAAVRHRAGRITVRQETFAVRLAQADDDMAEAVDDGYRRRYAESSALVLSERVRQATLCIYPHEDRASGEG
ncbi:DUF2255 family protein [Dactylosporangium salmoneum]|uniref:DUF2255 family protein n=1 Tax=Dactylosporangium salmoneum TaxID=53361 RepID=UPI0031D8C780